MIVSTSAPLPHNSLDPPTPQMSAAYNARKNAVFSAVANAASRYDCSAPIASFAGLGFNFQMQVQRATNLLTSIGQTLTQAQATGSSQTTSNSNPPQVVPLNPVQLTPAPSQNPRQQGPFDTPEWGNYSGQWPSICTPLTSLINALQAHPGWALGGMVAVALAAGVIGTGKTRRNPARKRRRR